MGISRSPEYPALITTLEVDVSRQGLHDITARVAQLIEREQVREGLCTLFIQHTSASLLIQENYDPSAKDDLENWLNRLVPENDPMYTHRSEGADDMPAHIKSSLTATSVSIPIMEGCLTLGTWQGIFLWEHRHYRGLRKVLVHVS
ncbi:MAG TPA: secondary thiamine-phosphate synthase enzyme YjbQ [Pseudomonadales bacterium]|nr:secondary thiamine-phosphate synthase enzyme YjbQ [Pseudomonadales bacterium]HJP49460.1 secondary thiamine-phosphate synthase enzyme YjbQ [Pseudomonadales bacterium]